MKTHPAADFWPMMSESRLRRLAEMIAQHGLLHPIVLDKQGLLIDGRNRLAACKIAGVEPTFITYEGDSVAYILNSNERRDVTLPQRAAATALTLGVKCRKNGRWIRGLVPELQELQGKEKTNDNGEFPNIKNTETWRSHMADAGLVLDYIPELLPRVVNEELALDGALKEAESRRDGIKRAEAQRREDAKLLAALPSDLRALVEAEQITLSDAVRRAALAPTYAARVTSGALTIEEAEHLQERDTKERREAIEYIAEFIRGFLSVIDAACSATMQTGNRADVLAALSEFDRQRFLRVENLLGINRMSTEDRDLLHDIISGREP